MTCSSVYSLVLRFGDPAPRCEDPDPEVIGFGPTEGNLGDLADKRYRYSEGTTTPPP